MFWQQIVLSYVFFYFCEDHMNRVPWICFFQEMLDFLLNVIFHGKFVRKCNGVINQKLSLVMGYVKIAREFGGIQEETPEELVKEEVP